MHEQLKMFFLVPKKPNYKKFELQVYATFIYLFIYFGGGGFTVEMCFTS